MASSLASAPMLSVIDLARRIDAGALSPQDAIALSLEAVAARDGAVRSFVRLNPAPSPGEGPLRGIAVGLKDIVDTADMPTEMGSAVYAGWRPRADAPVAMGLRRAGATILGKTATTPFAFLDPAETRNPRNLAHTPGGSSSGSAAAVAAGLVPLALGTQTGGSVIRPAAYCGVAAVKPSYRLLPTVGVKCFSWTLDTVGLFAATVADAAFALAALTGRPDLRLDGSGASTWRIGVADQDFAGAPEPDSAAALEAAIRALERRGATVGKLALPDRLADAYHRHGLLQDFEARQALAWEYDHHRERLPPLLRGLLDDAQAIEPGAYDDARRTAHRARGSLGQAFEACDLILTFSAPGAAPEGLASTGNSRFNRLWTLMGTPCVNVPGLAAENGLPVGLQVIAPFGDDARALAGAAFVEEAFRKAS